MFKAETPQRKCLKPRCRNCSKSWLEEIKLHLRDIARGGDGRLGPILLASARHLFGGGNDHVVRGAGSSLRWTNEQNKNALRGQAWISFIGPPERSELLSPLQRAKPPRPPLAAATALWGQAWIIFIGSPERSELLSISARRSERNEPDPPSRQQTQYGILGHQHVVWQRRSR